MLKGSLKLLPALLAGVLFAHSVRSAEISGSKRDDRVAVLEGVIVPGDYEKVSQFILSSVHSRIFLGSPGGDLGEAIKIGRLLREFKFQTIVPSRNAGEAIQKMLVQLSGLQNPQRNYVCTSACFFLFIAGIQRMADYGESPGLGIHRPYMSDADVRLLSADGAMKAATNTRAVVDAYLREMGVPAKYSDAMFSIQKDTIKWIDPESFTADFQGFIPELIDWVRARCKKLTDAERKIWDALKDRAATRAENLMVQNMLPKWSEQYRCEYDLQAELSLEAYEKALQAGKLKLR